MSELRKSIASKSVNNKLISELTKFNKRIDMIESNMHELKLMTEENNRVSDKAHQIWRHMEGWVDSQEKSIENLDNCCKLVLRKLHIDFDVTPEGAFLRPYVEGAIYNDPEPSDDSSSSGLGYSGDESDDPHEPLRKDPSASTSQPLPKMSAEALWPTEGDEVEYHNSRTNAWELATVSGVSWNVGLGEEPDVSVRLADGVVRDTTLGRLRRPRAITTVDLWDELVQLASRERMRKDRSLFAARHRTDPTGARRGRAAEALWGPGHPVVTAKDVPYSGPPAPRDPPPGPHQAPIDHDLEGGSKKSKKKSKKTKRKSKKSRKKYKKTKRTSRKK